MNLISKLIALKSGFVDVLMTAIALSLSVGIFGAVSIELFQLKSISTLIISATSVVVLVLYLAHRILSGLERTMRYKGALTFERRGDELIPIKIGGYKISTEVSGYLVAAFAENPALKKVWDNNPIACRSRVLKPQSLTSNLLIEQAVEYFLLEALSLHIQSYFIENDIDQSGLKEYSREDLPEFLLKNKFFELFTRPMEERPSFMEHNDNMSGEIVWAIGSDGAIFKHFELILPQGSKLERLEHGEIRINTKIFELTLNPKFEGFRNVWPLHFEALYLGLRDFRNSHSYQLNLNISVKFNQFSLLIGKGWEYYSWLDSLINKFENYIDEEAFLRDIGWKTIYTSYILSKNQSCRPE